MFDRADMNKLEAYYLLRRISEDAAFVANVVLTRHSKPAKRLKELAKLAKEGRQIRMADFSCDILLIDGKEMSWEDLDHRSLTPRS
jgi:hypothetical protein